MDTADPALEGEQAEQAFFCGRAKLVGREVSVAVRVPIEAGAIGRLDVGRLAGLDLRRRHFPCGLERHGEEWNAEQAVIAKKRTLLWRAMMAWSYCQKVSHHVLFLKYQVTGGRAYDSSFLYSNISPGEQSSTRQMASSVEKRIIIYVLSDMLLMASFMRVTLLRETGTGSWQLQMTNCIEPAREIICSTWHRFTKKAR